MTEYDEPGMEPPEEVREEAQQIRKKGIRGIVKRTDIFPPDMLDMTHRSEERVNHLIWIIRYRIAHRVVGGLAGFRAEKTKRIIAYKWAARETGTHLSQIQDEVATVHATDDNPHSAFQNHLMEFVEAYEAHESMC